MCAAKNETGYATARGNLLDAARAIQSAEDYLGRAAEATRVPETVKQIHDERQSLSAFLGQVTRVRALADDTLFAKAAAELKSQVASLRWVSDRIKQVDAATAAEAEGYMETAVTFIAHAAALISNLPQPDDP